ncbi:MAG TPA: peptidoglycan -binding protein [Xanthobacteraceae bacterium]|nr:peptidoglycan -binding protein [Xanthobacteraceae bacterium]
MALARARRGESGMNYWPGFVDALSTLILGIIFLLTVFVVVQFYLQQEVQGKDTALHRLDAQVAKLADMLSMEKAGNTDLQKRLGDLRASLTTAESDRDKYKSLSDSANADLAAAQSERDKYKSLDDSANAGLAAAQGKINDLTGSIQAEKKTSADALSQVEMLNQQIAALRQQMATIQSALDISTKKDQEAQTRITDLGTQLNLALAQRAQELSNYRSEFFGKLRDILGNRPDIRIVGDRFALQSEIFFDTGKADLKPEGHEELDKVATAIIGLESQIPANIPWVLRVDGHTDVRPVIGQFKSNWDLSAARAISVVNYLIEKGVKPTHLVAAAFGEFQPIDTGNTEDAYRRNRRIEFKLTDR